ncbi:hypothetical protein Bpfe_012458 [Biomphalaria pfeifferi]|uniref:Uncharacterized protein n=1 Tax=Biomphalaria pfeifferi TaxID=112525 RepID=A0AAD8BQU1_BIOPF|nr:hypothetical protein Bpfe_012458 [Biomphalaria pfeifferi]
MSPGFQSKSLQAFQFHAPQGFKPRNRRLGNLSLHHLATTPCGKNSDTYSHDLDIYAPTIRFQVRFYSLSADNTTLLKFCHYRFPALAVTSSPGKFIQVSSSWA